MLRRLSYTEMPSITRVGAREVDELEDAGIQLRVLARTGGCGSCRSRR